MLLALAARVDEGKGLMMIGGYESFGNSDWATTDIARLLPVELDAAGQREEPVQMVPTPEGYRQLPTEASGPELVDVVNEYLQDIRVAQNLVVLRTSPGSASPLAVALDNEELVDVVGTVAGDDTVLVVTRDAEAAERLRTHMMDLISAG